MGDELKNLSKWRLEKAERCLRSAQTLLDDEDYSSAANRSYYSVFHCMRSVLALQGVDFKKHSAVIAHFREKYIKTGIQAFSINPCPTLWENFLQ